MRIAIMGAGSVGATLGRRLADHHEVVFGVRDPAEEKIQRVVAKTPGARATSVRDAAAGAELVLLAVPWEAVRDVLREAGPLENTIVVDATNPVALGDGIGAGLALGHTTSAAEQIAAWAPRARIVKAFNTTGFPNMAAPRFGDRSAAMFVCGDDQAARKTVLGLATELGFDAVDCGPLRIARLLEPTAMLWIHLALFQGLGPDFAFGLLRR